MNMLIFITCIILCKSLKLNEFNDEFNSEIIVKRINRIDDLDDFDIIIEKINKLDEYDIIIEKIN